MSKNTHTNWYRPSLVSSWHDSDNDGTVALLKACLSVFPDLNNYIFVTRCRAPVCAVTWQHYQGHHPSHTGRPTEVRCNCVLRHHVNTPVIHTGTHTHIHTHITITWSLATVFHSAHSICFDQYMEGDPRPVQCLLLTNKGVLWLSVVGPPLHFCSAAMLIG